MWFCTENYRDRFSSIQKILITDEVKKKQMLASKGVGCLERVKNLTLDSHTIKEFGRTIAERTDGDAIAQHRGYGVDSYATNDIVSYAGTCSVMQLDNNAKLEKNMD